MKIPKNIKPLKAEELAYFCTQLALVLKSGVPLNDGLMMMLDDTKDSEAIFLISNIVEDVENERPFYQALENTTAFSNYFISMIKIGELTGRLDDVLDGLAAYYERESNLKSSLKSAIMHPMILLFMMSAVIAILVLKVLPIFKQVFGQLGSQMSDSSAAAIEFATSTGIVVLCGIGILIILVVVLYSVSHTTKGKHFLYLLLSNIFIFKNLLDKISICCFSSAMSLMLSSGIETSEALELGEEVVTNKNLQKKIVSCQEKIRNHQPFAQAITEVGIFPTLYSQMIKISYKTGALDTVWSKISKKYDDDVSESLNNLVAFIEPLLVGILSIIIGTILISVMLPLMGVMSALG